jgi:tRNA-specific 2-thiouridylase
MSKVLVAMSGGVDSSVAAALLKRDGHDVLGVHMKLHDEVKEVISKSCCGQQDAIDANIVCSELNIPYFVTDYRAHFKKFVLQNFVEEYFNGRTPIPCTHCNGILKFNLLIELAQTLGYDYVATGHYAQLIDNKLYKAFDSNKDQSYFLFPIDPLFRSKILFPLATLTKENVRALAKELDLPIADKQESQNLCFAPNGTHKEFLEKQIVTYLSGTSGLIKHENGNTLGKHNGLHNFTIGQRRGLNITQSNNPLFVTRIDKDTSTVYVSDIRDANAVTSFRVDGWISWEEPTPTNDIEVVIRYRKNSIPVKTISLDDVYGSKTIHIETPTVVTPGQAAVVYRQGQVIGGGWIR